MLHTSKEAGQVGVSWIITQMEQKGDPSVDQPRSSKEQTELDSRFNKGLRRGSAPRTREASEARSANPIHDQETNEDNDEQRTRAMFAG